MKTTLRTVSALFALVMVIGVLAACGNNVPAVTTGPAVPATTGATEGSVPFVAPPDQVGLVISADTQLVTWQAYETKEDTIDFKSVNVKSLGNPGEMTLVYMEDEVTYYSLVTGELVKTTIDDIVPGAVIGITTLEEGVMEVYILSVPVEETEDEDDTVEEFVDVTIPSETAFSEPSVPDDFEESEDAEGDIEGDNI